MKALLVCSCLFLINLSVSSQTLSEESLLGNWIVSDGSNTWGIGLMSDYVVYESEFWDYQRIESSGNSWTIALRNSESEKTLSVKSVGETIIVQDGKKTLRLLKDRLGADRVYNPSREVFPDDFLQTGQVELTGVVAAKDTMPLVATVIYNDAFSEDQAKYNTTIDERGRFTLIFPLDHAQDIMLKVGDAFFTILAEPNSEMAIYVDEASFDGAQWTDVKELLFMGRLAQENEERRLAYPEYMKIRNYFENDSLQQELDAMGYLDYRIALMEDHLKFFKDYFEKYPASPKTIDHATRDVRIYAADDLLRYRWMHGRKSGNITPVDVPNEYEARVMELFTDDERDMMSGEYSWVMREYSMAMMPKNQKPMHQVRLDQVYGFLKGKTISEKNLRWLEEWKQGELERENHRGYLKFTDSLKTLTDQYKSEIDLINKQVTWDMLIKRNENHTKLALSSIVSVHLDQVYLSRGDDIPESIWNKFLEMDILPVAKQALIEKYNDHQLYKNQRFVEGIEISESTDNVLSELKKKYKDKVIYIDVWATWCGPCITEFGNIPEVKAEFKDRDDVVFAYICAQSKKNQWELMVKKYNLKGDNFFLDDGQYALFDKEIKVTGFPTYMVITKEGKLVREGVKRPSSGKQLIEQLREFANRKKE